eukprot:gb/GECH01012270.1/.p1 GENE.gb/GECH01012270.1/~~gb/GECH01012270.1/.p1  ORF type:complete len:470 (+),score=90.73 gb/GECH01012270.1/:1-1410(+)
MLSKVAKSSTLVASRNSTFVKSSQNIRKISSSSSTTLLSNSATKIASPNKNNKHNNNNNNQKSSYLNNHIKNRNNTPHSAPFHTRTPRSLDSVVKNPKNTNPSFNSSSLASTANSAAIHSSTSQNQPAAAAAAASAASNDANITIDPPVLENDLYPTRVFSEPKVLDRSEPVVWPRNENLNLPSEPLTEQELNEYRDNGFLVMRNVLSQDVVNECREDIKDMLQTFENRGETKVTSDVKYVTEPGSGTLRSIFETHKDTQHHIGHVVRRPEILNRARQILQDNIYVHQSRINFHRAFKGTGFSWHSDFETWHVEDGVPGMRALSCVVFLTNNDSSNGALMVIPGSHKKFISCVGETPQNNWEKSLKHQQEVGVPDGNNLRRMAALARENGTEDINIVHATGRPGDVLFFDCNLLHGSHSNISPFDRTNAFFVLNSMSNKIQDVPNPRPEHIACRDPKWTKPLTPLEDKN